jgi:hypothetical protein
MRDTPCSLRLLEADFCSGLSLLGTWSESPDPPGVGDTDLDGFGGSSLRIKLMNAFTNPEGLNLGRQKGIQDVGAGLLNTEGVLMVLRIMCKSMSRLDGDVC